MWKTQLLDIKNKPRMIEDRGDFFIRIGAVCSGHEVERHPLVCAEGALSSPGSGLDLRLGPPWW